MISRRQFLLSILLASILGGIVTVAGFKLFTDNNSQFQSIEDRQNGRLSNFLFDSSFTVPAGINFVYAAKAATPAVVFIRSTYFGKRSSSKSFKNPFNDLYDYFKDNENEQRDTREGISSGSGVIITNDGYIVTNNHVIEEADKVEVTLSDNRIYDAEVIGTDPNTDLALLKIEEEELSFVKFGDSDIMEIGEWVLAIGNPFGTLTSTVTAGIVSAKARSISILYQPNGYPVESFIQTDAAVNQGNSGGALVNLKGELVGINTAIATQTGSYSGYSFAVPVTLVRKVAEDLLKFGTVQRALLGVSIQPVTARLAEEENLAGIEGVYVAGVGNESAASDAGIRAGDVILEINEVRVGNVAALQELVARNRPGDEIEVTFRRGTEVQKVYVTLKNTMGDTQIVMRPEEVNVEGSIFIDPDKRLTDVLKIEGGAQLDEIGPGKWEEEGFKEGFIITSIDKQPIKNAKALKDILLEKNGGILIEGYFPDGNKEYFGLSWK